MITEINVVTIVSGICEETGVPLVVGYDIRDQNGEYLHDNDNIEDAIITAVDLADAHEVPFVKLQVELEYDV